MTSHFSLSIQALSSSPDAMVLSLAMVKFSPMDEGTASFHASLMLEEQKGRTVDTVTLHKWFRDHSMSGCLEAFPAVYLPPKLALLRLNDFIGRYTAETPPTPTVWLRNPHIDMPILRHLAAAEGTHSLPPLCYIKTLADFEGEDNAPCPLRGASALREAIHQANKVRRVLAAVGQETK